MKAFKGRFGLSLLTYFALVGAALIFFLTLPDVRIVRDHFPVVRYEPAKQEATVSFVKERPQTWVRLGNVSDIAVKAIIVSEDYGFYRHHGIDWDELSIAVNDGILEGKKIRGASTITQQLAKNLFLTKHKTFIRKMREFFLARRLEKILSKSEILEYYLNVIEWGPGIYGIRRASEVYFRKSPAALDAKEGAFLAMLLPNPKKYAASFGKKQLTPYAHKTVNRILDKMATAGHISRAEAAHLKDQPLAFENVNLPVLPEASEDADEIDTEGNAESESEPPEQKTFEPLEQGTPESPDDQAPPANDAPKTDEVDQPPPSDSEEQP